MDELKKSALLKIVNKRKRPKRKVQSLIVSLKKNMIIKPSMFAIRISIVLVLVLVQKTHAVMIRPTAMMTIQMVTSPE